MCFQEVNEFWFQEMSLLLPEWVLHRAPSPTKVVTAHKRTAWGKVTEAMILPLFPEEKQTGCPYRWWRQFLQVSAGHLLVLLFA